VRAPQYAPKYPLKRILMSLKILIADDHAVFRSGLKALLEKEPNMQVIGETGNGFDTIRAVEEMDVDVLILDITMPGLPGPRVAETVLKTKPNLTIVVLTMHEDEYYLQELFRLGAKAFVLKKSTGTDVVQAILSAHKGDNYIDPALTNVVISSFVGRQPKKLKSNRLNLITPREQEVIVLLAFGHTNAEIGEKLCISERTVETHRTNIMSKLELKSRAELVRFAIDNGLFNLH
jgi:two-component system, NarL family, response regulator NreC